MSRTITVAEARALYERGGGAHDFEHVLRVVGLAEKIAQSEDADVSIVRTAALLHDVAESSGRSDHHTRGAAIARELLQGEPKSFVAAVAHAIEAHRFRAEPAPRTLEAQILSDADKLDAIGALGVARVFAHAGQRGTALWRVPVAAIEADPDGARAGPERLGDAYTPSHEYVYKLERIPERLYTATARLIARERLDFMRAFFARLDQEAAGAA